MPRRTSVISVAALIAALLGAQFWPLAARPASASSAGTLRVLVLSSKPAWVSGSRALVDVVLPGEASDGRATIRLGHRDVSRDFAAGRLAGLLGGVPVPRALGIPASSPGLVGLVTGITPGHHVLQATMPDGRSTTLAITDYPAAGPMFAGTPPEPWLCDDGSKLASCATATTYAYYYVPVGAAALGNQLAVGSPPVSNQFLPYDPTQPPPAALVAKTTNDEGVEVPFVVRVETGVVDRGTYQIAVLDTPGVLVDPWHSPPGWDHKLDVEVGGNCRTWHEQTTGLPVFDIHALARGYAVLTAGLDVLGNDCNPVRAAEAIAMAKSRLITEYGLVRFTVGEGCSGGSMILNLTTADYPGIVDGSILMCSFPDIWEVAQQAEDCHLLDRVFDHHLLEWPVTAQDDVTGFLEPTTCRSLFDGTQGLEAAQVPDYAQSLFDPAVVADCTSVSKPSWVYSPTTNPRGQRCDLQDYQSAIWGHRPKSAWGPVERRIHRGFANRPFDNVGVQYGLTALRRHEISVKQFLDLNRAVGGIDIDWNHTGSRSVADPHALTVAYRTGQVIDPHAQAQTPIIDIRGHDNEEIHVDVNSYVERARLRAANGSLGNEALWLELGAYEPEPVLVAHAFDEMDDWLSAIERDSRAASLKQKVIADRPSAVVDSCWTESVEITNWSLCRKAFPHGADPRLAAGGPATDNVLKCRLMRPRRGSYRVAFTDTQWKQLLQVFPGGVCNASARPVGWQRSKTWVSFNRPRRT